MELLNNRIIEDSIYFDNKLTNLITQLNQCCKTSKTKSSSLDNAVNEYPSPIDASALYQNAPNPFNQSTTIGYYLPLTVGKAAIYIYNMEGIQIKSIPITDRRNGNVIVNGNELKPGMYIYSLIVDGKEIDTKRMILTQ
jgi:hypothetical protein